jgi:hypothetical protein
MQGRLNIFQKTMLQWNAMHPYSAVHVARVRGAFDATRLRTCINTTVEKRGLSRLTLDREQCRFQYESGPANCDMQIISGGQDPQDALVAEMERQLNLPFAPARSFSPFRFLVASAGDSFFLGLVYFHPVADAESVVCLLKDIVATYAGEGTGGGHDSLDLYPDHHAHLLRRHPMAVARTLLTLPAQIRNLRQSCRARYCDAGDMANGFVCFSVGPENLRLLVTAAKSWGVTVNDLLLALLMKALSPCAAARARARKRRKISVGCIVNIRKNLGVDSQRTFGLFLGSFRVTHKVPVGISLRELAGDIQQQTSFIKRHKLYLATPLELGFARFMLKFFSPERQKRFYAKHCPLWGGVTNMNLNLLWEQGGSNAPLDYFRGVSTGPVTPLVMSVTTIGDRVNLGLSYRTTVFSRSDIEGLQCRFRKHLEETQSDL